MMWEDEHGCHWILDGVHWFAPHPPVVPDWTPEQEQAAVFYLRTGYAVVVVLAVLEIVFILSVLP